MIVGPSRRARRQECRPESGIQRLNPIDRAMRCADRAIRRLGYPGIETQMFVWLDGRADSSALRKAIARLSRHCPVVASRLVDWPDDQGGNPYWRWRADAVCALQETTLSSDDPNAVLEDAGGLLSIPRDPSQSDPLRFHLLHRPGGKDVLLLQYNHVLMDNKATVVLLRQLDRLSQADVDSVPCLERGDLILEHLRRFPRHQRREATARAIDLQAHGLRGRAATLRSIGPDPVGPPPLRIAARVLEPQAATPLRSRITALCGFPSFSMAVLGSAFRAIDRLGPGDGRRNFIAGIGVDLNLRRREAMVFQNLSSVVPIRADREKLHDRDRLTRLLCSQMRDRLAERIDLGALRTTALFSRRPRYVDWVVEHLLRFGYSLWYAYFGSLDPAGRELCGARIENVFYAGPVWPSTGLTLLVNQHCGRLHFQATYDPRLVPPSLADEFLASVLGDLMA